MYDQYYGFQGRPFQLTPDPHYYFESATHRKALSYLGYGLAQGEGFIVITGDIGAGKTTLVGHLMQTIDPMRLTAVKIVSTQVEGDDMLRLAAQSFGLHVDGLTKAATLQQVETYLHHQARSGRRTLLIVDEAQNLSVSAIEELRMLSNFQLGGQSLLQIFLLGQPEFRDLLKSPELEQLRQRVIATHHLEPMHPAEVEPYIIHRLTVAGWVGNPVFTPQAFAALYAATGGVPRRLNALVSRVLLLGAIDQLRDIDADVVQAVVADMGLDAQPVVEAVEPSILDEVEEPVAPAYEQAEIDSDADIWQQPVEETEPVAEQDDVPQPAPFAPPFAATAEPVDEPVAEAQPMWTPAAYGAPTFEDGTPYGDLPETFAAGEPVAEQFVAEEPIVEESVPETAQYEDPIDHEPVYEPMSAFAEPMAEEQVEAEPTIAEPTIAEPAFAEQTFAAQPIAQDDVPEAPPVAEIDDLRHDMMAEIEALRAEIASLRAVQSHTPFAPAQAVDPEALKDCFTLIEERLASLEFRAEEQDTALRRVLTLLVDWVEREEQMAAAQQDVAAA